MDATRKRGYLTGDPDWIDPGFIRAYDWMKQKMAERLADYSGDYPVWAMPHRPNRRQQFYNTEPRVLVTAIVPMRRVLPSDHSTWHCVLNHQLISATDEEEKRMLETGTPPEATWEGVLDYNLPPRSEWATFGRRTQIQLCVDRIYLSEIVSVLPDLGRVERPSGRR